MKSALFNIPERFGCPLGHWSSSRHRYLGEKKLWTKRGKSLALGPTGGQGKPVAEQLAVELIVFDDEDAMFQAFSKDGEVTTRSNCLINGSRQEFCFR
jgi:hypothetical protein